MMSANFSGGSYGILPLYIRHGGYFHQSFTEYLLSLFNWSELTSTCLLHPPSVGTTKQILKTLRQEQPCTLILMKATLFILIKLKMIDHHRHWRISTVFNVSWVADSLSIILWSSFEFVPFKLLLSKVFKGILSVTKSENKSRSFLSARKTLFWW